VLSRVVIQVIGEVCKQRSQFKFDKRMTGSTAIDEVLQEVHIHFSDSLLVHVAIITGPHHLHAVDKCGLLNVALFVCRCWVTSVSTLSVYNIIIIWLV